MAYHYEWTRTVGDVHDATGIPRDGSGQRLIRNRLRNNEFGDGWEKRGEHRNSPYYMDEPTFQNAVRILRQQR
jgi:hypothetical protein